MVQPLKCLHLLTSKRTVALLEVEVEGPELDEAQEMKVTLEAAVCRCFIRRSVMSKSLSGSNHTGMKCWKALLQNRCLS